MPRRSHVITLTAGGDDGRVAYNIPSTASLTECQTRLALARRDGFDTDEQKIAAQCRESDALVQLAVDSLRMLHGEWDGYESDLVLSHAEATQWAEDYGAYALALGQYLAFEYLGKSAAIRDGQKKADETDKQPEVSGDAVNPTQSIT